MNRSLAKALTPKEKQFLELMKQPVDKLDHDQEHLQRICSRELMRQLNVEGTNEAGGTKAWPALKESYYSRKVAWAKREPKIRYYGRRIMILFGELEKSLKSAEVTPKHNSIEVEWAKDVVSEDGFDYPSYWQAQNGPLSPVHAGFRPFTVTPEFNKAIGNYIVQRLNLMARKMLSNAASGSNAV